MDQLKPLIAELIKLVEGGKDIVNDQLPDLCKQIIRLYLWGNVIEIPILLSILVALGYCGKWVYRKANDDDSVFGLLFIPLGILAIVVGCYTYGCGQTLLMALLAPKLLILVELNKFL